MAAGGAEVDARAVRLGRVRLPLTTAMLASPMVVLGVCVLGAACCFHSGGLSCGCVGRGVRCIGMSAV